MRRLQRGPGWTVTDSNAKHAHESAGYPCGMSTEAYLEDARGVDVARIRELLAMTPAQRVEHMVEVINTMLAVSQHAQAARN